MKRNHSAFKRKKEILHSRINLIFCYVVYAKAEKIGYRCVLGYGNGYSEGGVEQIRRVNEMRNEEMLKMIKGDGAHMRVSKRIK